MQDIISRIEKASALISPHILLSPVIEADQLSELTGCRVLMKLENLQPTRSFKIRGALNKILNLSTEDRQNGVVTASSGNHGAAVSKAIQLTGGTAEIFLPNNVSEAKLKAIESYGGQISYFGEEAGETELHAREVAEKTGRVYISPYNDLDVIAGQGTIALELLQQAPEIDAVVIAVGGGGLASGIASYLKSSKAEIQTIGCSPVVSQAMIKSIEAGRVIEVAHGPTLSDGTAGGIEDNALTLDLCRQNLDRLVTATEEEIAAALIDILVLEKIVVEGAAALTLAALQKIKSNFQGKTVCLIICGGNLSAAVITELL
jgi:threonine dehydratase